MSFYQYFVLRYRLRRIANNCFAFQAHPEFLVDPRFASSSYIKSRKRVKNSVKILYPTIKRVLIQDGQQQP